MDWAKFSKYILIIRYADGNQLHRKWTKSSSTSLTVLAGRKGLEHEAVSGVGRGV